MRGFHPASKQIPAGECVARPRLNKLQTQQMAAQCEAVDVYCQRYFGGFAVCKNTNESSGGALVGK